MKIIKILGTGCPKCNQLAANAKEAAEEASVSFTIEKISQLNDIMSYGVMVTPGLVIDEEVKAVGKVPTVEEIKQMLV